MRERDAEAADLSRMLMKVIDEQVGYLRGAIAAATAICDLLFDEAEQNRAVHATNIGLRWSLEEAEAAVAALSEDLHAAHKLARVEAERAGEVLAEAREARTAVVETVRGLAERVTALEGGQKPAEPAS